MIDISATIVAFFGTICVWR